MFSKKSFNLVEKDPRKPDRGPTERFYEPKNFRWCKYIAIPFLIGFVLLLILSNVDFSGNAYNTTREISTNAENVSALAARIVNTDSLEDRGLVCLQGVDDCSLLCQGGNVNNVNKKVETLYKICGQPVELHLKDCTFPAGNMKSNYFEGNFELENVTIENCNLNNIELKTFQQSSVRNLKNLRLLQTQFTQMEATIFEGLENLENFQFINMDQLWTAFKGNSFLGAFKNSLKSLKIEQITNANLKRSYNPLEWLRGYNMNKLEIVNLENNNFDNLLTNETFSTLILIRDLDLRNCGITYLEVDVFTATLNTLEVLNLSENLLTILSDETALQLTQSLHALHLQQNQWNCSCDNSEVLSIIVNGQNVIDKYNLTCWLPIEFKDMKIIDLKTECFEKTSTALSTKATATNADSTIDETTEEETTFSENNESPQTYTTEMLTTWSQGTTGTGNETEGSVSESTINTTNDLYSTTEYSTVITSTVSETTENEVETTNDSNEQTEETSEIIKTSNPPIVETTTTPAHPTTTVKCYSHKTGKQFEKIIQDKVFYFYIENLKKIGVRLKVQHFSTTSSFNIVYFNNNKQFKNTTNNLPSLNNSTMQIAIRDIVNHQSYVFCLLYGIELGPFDCQSHYVFWKPEPWLLNDDQVWIISIVVLGVCLASLLGIIVTIVLIKWKRNYKNQLANPEVEGANDENNKITGNVRMQKQSAAGPSHLMRSVSSCSNRYTSGSFGLTHIPEENEHYLYESRFQVPDVIISSPLPDCGSHYSYADLVDYEEINL